MANYLLESDTEDYPRFDRPTPPLDNERDENIDADGKQDSRTYSHVWRNIRDDRFVLLVSGETGATGKTRFLSSFDGFLLVGDYCVCCGPVFSVKILKIAADHFPCNGDQVLKLVN